MESSGIGGVKRPHDIADIPVTEGGDAESAKRARMASGNMDGNNLVISDYNADGVADGDVIGSKPTLSPPTIEPTMAGYQTALAQLEGADSKTTEHAMMKVLGQRLGNDAALAIARQPVPPIGRVDETDTTITAELGSENTFHADFSKGEMRVMLGDNQVDFKMNSGNPSVTIDGQPVNFNSNELGALSDFFVLMELFHEMGVSQRKMSREARNTLNSGVVKNIKSQAVEQRKSALSNLLAGVMSGTVKMASAGLSMTGAVKGMKADAAAAKAGQPPQSFQGQMISQKYSSLGTIFDGAGELGASGARYDAAQHDAQQTVLRAGEEQLKHVKQTEQDQMQVAQELLNKAKETFAQVWAQTIQTLLNQTRNI